MPLLHRAKKDKVAAAPTLTSELPPSPPASNSRNSFNSSGVNSSSARSENQGNVMVTTTTTTVTTTTSNAGPHSSEPRVESRNQGDYNSSTSDFSGAGPYGPGSRQSDYNRPEPMNHGYEAPHIPPRNNMRNQYPETGGAGSGTGYGPPDPNSSSPNFSRPRGTVEGIKSAAHGIHGAGEVLRGTFNSAVDRSLHLPPEVVQQDRNVAYNGRREIREGYRPGHHMGQTGGSSRPLPAVDERTTILSDPGTAGKHKMGIINAIPEQAIIRPGLENLPRFQGPVYLASVNVRGSYEDPITLTWPELVSSNDELEQYGTSVKQDIGQLRR